MALSLKYNIRAKQVTFYTLLLWSIIGFASTLENTTQWGCIKEDYVFSFRNIVYSALSVSLLGRGFFSRPQKEGGIFISGELVFWVYKLLFIKGGYVVGYAGATPEDIVLYDFIALTLRLLFIKQLLGLPFRTVYVLVPALLIMVLKLLFFR